MRRFAWFTARYELESGASTTVLGRLWLFLSPAFMIAIYWLLFGLILQVNRGTENFVAFLSVGLVVFSHNRSGITQASSSLVRKTAILQSLSFPRAVLPLAAVFRELGEAALSSIVLIVFLPIMGAGPRIGWLLLIPLMAVQATMNFGIGMLIARPITRFGDLRQAMPFIFRLLFYGSGILFPLEQFLVGRANGLLALDVITINPFFSVAAVARWMMLGLEPHSPALVLISVVAWTVLSVVIGLPVFLRGERHFSGIRTVRLAS